MHQDLEALASILDFDASETNIVVYNVVAPGSKEHLEFGLRPGSCIYSNKDEALKGVVAPLLNFFCIRSWVTATESRWTNVGTTALRVIMSEFAKNLVPGALLEVKVSLKVEDGLEDALAKLVAIDQGDLSAKNKLRLLRMCRTFSMAGFTTEIGVMALAGGPVERMQYALLGHRRKRSSLEQLLHPTESPRAACQHELLALAATFSGEDGGQWELLLWLLSKSR